MVERYWFSSWLSKTCKKLKEKSTFCYEVGVLVVSALAMVVGTLVSAYLRAIIDAYLLAA